MPPLYRNGINLLYFRKPSFSNAGIIGQIQSILLKIKMGSEETPQGQRFTHLYTDRSKSLMDSQTFRKRIGFSLDSDFKDNKIDLALFLKKEMGFDVPVSSSEFYLELFFMRLDINYMLDAITLVWRFFNQKDEANYRIFGRSLGLSQKWAAGDGFDLRPTNRLEKQKVNGGRKNDSSKDSFYIFFDNFCRSGLPQEICNTFLPGQRMFGFDFFYGLSPVAEQAPVPRLELLPPFG